jgi:hypothetical protein
VRIDGLLFARRHVYDATSHELVGMFLRDDIPRHTCGASQVHQIQAGVDPIANGCHVAKRESCPDGGRGDAEVGTPDSSALQFTGAATAR